MQRKIKIDPKTYTKPRVIIAKENEEYLLIDTNTKKSPNKIKLVKVNNDLEVYFEGNEYYPSVIIQDYYAQNINTSIIGMDSSAYQAESNDGWKYLTNSENINSFELSTFGILGITTIFVGAMISVTHDNDSSNSSFTNTKNQPDTNNSTLTAHVSPLILDLDADGINTISFKKGVNFDINGDSRLEQTGWIDGKDGFLVLDVNKDGIINDGSELFGQGTNLSNGMKANTGYEALSQYDTNKDNLIDTNDHIFESLQVWVDENVDAITTKDELFTLSQLGIKSISLDFENSDITNNENIIGLVSSWQDINNNTNELADVWFKTKEIENISSNTNKWTNTTTEENLLVDRLFSEQTNIVNEEVIKNQAII